MLPVTEEGIKGLELTFTLDDRQQAILSSAVKQEWFHVLQQLMEQEIRLMNIKLLNTSSANPQEILANHAVAKGAGMFYAGIMQRLREILQIETIKAQGIGSPENPEVPPLLDEVS
jgi:hypothetical protein